MSGEGSRRAFSDMIQNLESQGVLINYFDYADSMSKQDPKRKPNAGMGEELIKKLETEGYSVDKS